MLITVGHDAARLHHVHHYLGGNSIGGDRTQTSSVEPTPVKHECPSWLELEFEVRIALGSLMAGSHLNFGNVER